MALVKSVLGKSPQYGQNCYLAETATLIGDVVMGNNCSLWFGAVVRGDVHYIRMGNNVNVQDNATVHCTYQKYPTTIGNNVSIAHNAIVHGCTIGNNVLIGMGAIVMDGAEIEENCIIAAGAVVTQGTKIASGSVYAGAPAKRIKSIDDALSQGQIERIAQSYIKYASWYKDE